MREYIVPYIGKGSSFGVEEAQVVSELLQSDDTLACGIQRDAFETEFASYVGAKHAIAVSSCSVALEIATRLINFQPGDSVIVTPQSYQATINPLLDLPIDIRFADINDNSLCLDPESVEKLISARTRAIYLTHYGGLMAEMDGIVEIAAKHRLIVVEDCAHAHGSEYKGRRPGAFGHIGCYSFQSLKNMSTLGQGGMITLDNDDWANTVNRLRALEPDADFAPRRQLMRFGTHPTPQQDLNRHAKNAYTEDCLTIRARGMNATLSEPAAAVGRVQLRKLESFVKRRQSIGTRLNTSLSKISGLRIQEVPTEFQHAFHLFTFFVDPRAGLDRERVAMEIDRAGVEIQLRYFPLHLLPEWRLRGGSYGQCPVTERVWFEEQINLPIYPSMSDNQVDYMINAVNTAVRNTRR